MVVRAPHQLMTHFHVKITPIRFQSTINHLFIYHFKWIDFDDFWPLFHYPHIHSIEKLLIQLTIEMIVTTANAAKCLMMLMFSLVCDWFDRVMNKEWLRVWNECDECRSITSIDFGGWLLLIDRLRWSFDVYWRVALRRKRLGLHIRRWARNI